jgi:hypothetical protein
MDIVRDGQPHAKVVVPADAHPLTLQAAGLLVRYVRQMTGAALEIVHEGDPRASAGCRMFLGATNAAKAEGIDVSALRFDGFLWKTSGDRLFIVGRDALFPPENDVNGSRACRGTAMGVLRLLEEFGHVRWFLPTSNGEVVPQCATFTVPDGLDRKEEPTFAFIGGAFGQHGSWSWANGLRCAVNVKIQGHTWEAALRRRGDPKQLFDSDPTRFALVSGKRLFTPSNQHLCTMHPDFVQMNVDYLSSLFESGYQWVEYNQSDGYARCDCEKCNAMDQMDELEPTHGAYWGHEVDLGLSPAERLWVPFAEIARRLYEKYPDRKIIPLSYGPTYIPSRKVTKFSPNVMISLCRQEPRYFAAYAGYKKTAWTYWWGTYRVQGLTPKSPAHQTAARLRALAAHQVVGFYPCGGDELWGLEGPAYYVLAKLAWNPNRDVEETLEDYYRGVFHKAAPEMKEFFALLEDRIAAGEKTQTREEWQRNECFIPCDKYFPAAYPSDILAQLDAILHRARARVQDDAFASQWLALTELQYRYLKIVATGFNMHQEYQKRQDPGLRRQLAGAVNGRKAFLQDLDQLRARKTFLIDWFPGAATYMASAVSGGEIYGKLDIRPPFNGEF